jgi:diguanylate cyclase (GGDEF)-like protein
VDESAILGRSLLSLVPVEERALLLTAFREAHGNPEAAPTVQARVSRPDGEPRVVDCRFANLLADPTVEGIVVRFRDVSEHYVEREQLFHKAFYDELTGLPRRELMRDRIVQALRARRDGLLDVAVLFVDLDEFKAVNDGHGHAVGDEVLRGVAVRLAACVRDGDSAARVGGDEFAVLLSERVAESDVIAVAARIVRSFDVPLIARDREVTLGASVGVALARAEDDADGLLRRADRAMYEAKRRGGRQWVLHTASLSPAQGQRTTDF